MNLIYINIQKVVQAGSVLDAIIQEAEDSADCFLATAENLDDLTHLPGLGWTVDDYAKASIHNQMSLVFDLEAEYEAMDPTTGLVATAVMDFDDEDNWCEEITWSETSRVDIELPDVSEVFEAPEAFVQMAYAAIVTYKSNVDDWMHLVREIRRLSVLLCGIHQD